MEKPFYLTFLRSELQKRSDKNSKYSLRAFARQLDLDAGTLSSILNGKRPLSMDMAEKILTRLKCNESTREIVLSSVARFHSQRPMTRRDPKIKNYSFTYNSKKKVLGLDIFHIISDWYHQAILEMTYLDNFSDNPEWIARELNISVPTAKLALNRLIEYGLIEKKPEGYTKKDAHLEIEQPYLTSSARKSKQIQIRTKAIESIKQDPVDSRYMTTITMCIDPDLLPAARKKIDAFNDTLCAFLESGKRKQVYVLEMGLFSLQRMNLNRGKNEKSS
ncbi:MAG: TIGR02147 family protein [Bdellovibrionales bacterium]|nr:TIGR02147 family protein [Bdellovibrionales bacterium]